MARPIKQGLDYFPFDVDFFEDEKIAAISGEYGLKGEIVAIRLLCAIYRNGYFILWTEMLRSKFLRDLQGIKPELLDQIVKRLVRWGFFDQTLFNSSQILTSLGIQQRYFEATKGRRVQAQIDPKICLLGVSATKTPVSATETLQKPEFLTQKVHKVKESKEKKNKFFSQCAPAGCYPLSAEEKEKIFEIFFFSNLQNPDGELSAYIDHNTALGWMCGSSPISDKVAYAKGWVKKKTEKEANVTPRFPAPFLAQYRLFCDALQAERVDLLPVFLHGLYGLKIEQKKLTLVCSAEVAKTLKTDDMVRQAFTENVLAGRFAGYDLSCVKPTIGQTER